MSDVVTAPITTPTAVDPRADATKAIPGAPATPGAQTGDVAAAAKEAVRKLKITYHDGVEEEVDEEEAKKVYRDRKSHQREASKRMQEASQKRKEAEEFVAMMRDKGKLKDVLKKLGHDPRKISEEILAEHLEEDLMDPRDKELRDAKRQLAQIEEMDKRQKEAVEARRLEEVKTKYMKEYEADFVKALETSNLPQTKGMVAEMAKYIARSAKIGFKMTAVEAAQLVKEDVLAAHQRLIGDADGDVLIKLLGDQVANKIRKYDRAKIKTPEQVLRSPLEQSDPTTRRDRSAGTKRMTPQEWRLHKMGKL